MLPEQHSCRSLESLWQIIPKIGMSGLGALIAAKNAVSVENDEKVIESYISLHKEVQFCDLQGILRSGYIIPLKHFERPYCDQVTWNERCAKLELKNPNLQVYYREDASGLGDCTYGSDIAVILR